MYKDFEGRTETEALSKAREELGLENDDVYVEILEQVKKGLFKKSYVKIRVYDGEDDENEEDDNNISSPSLEPENENERKLIAFLTELISKMGYEGKVQISSRKDNKISLKIESDDSNILIGRKGRNLDAIQLLANVYIGHFDEDVKVVVDTENYRKRHEEQIIRSAYRVAEYVRKSGRSKLLEPMNPFERRLVHTSLNDVEGVDTKSEGEGLYKQVRIIPLKRKDNN